MKQIHLIIYSLLMFLSTSSFAQFSPSWSANYSHTPSLNFSNESRKMIKDASGNIFILADATSDIDPLGVQGTTTFHYTVLLKYDDAGNLVHTIIVNVMDHFVSGFNNRSAFGIDMDAAGSLYLGFSAYDATNGFNVCLAKYNPTTMVRLWLHTFNPTTTDQGIDMKVGSGGNVYAIAKSTSGSNSTYHLLKANANGSSTTSLYAFDLNLDFLSTMVVDVSNNDIYVTGYRLISNIKNALTAGVKDAGTLKWKKTFNGGTIIRDDSGRQIILATDDHVYVCGSSDRGNPNLMDVMTIGYYKGNGKFKWVNYFDYLGMNEAGFTLKQLDASSLYVASTSGNNVLVSRHEMNNGTVTGQGVYQPVPLSGYSSLTGVSLGEMEVSASKNIYLTGTITGNDLSSQSFSASYLVKIKPSSSRITGLNNLKKDFEFDVEGTNAGSYIGNDIILDVSSSRIYFLRDKIQTNTTHAEETIQLMALDIPTPNRIGDSESVLENELTINPNPASDYVEISATEKIRSVTITDQTGRLIKRIEGKNELRLSVDLTDVVSGAYFVVLDYSSGESTTSTLLKK